MKKIISLVVCVVMLFPQSTTSAHIEDEVPLRTLTLEEYGRKIVQDTWDDGEWEAFYQIINKESGWRVTGEHYKDSKAYITDTQKFIDMGITVHSDDHGYYIISSAYGLGGFINATWGMVGCSKTDNGYTQLECVVRYIELVYGTPTNALQIHSSQGHY